MRTYELRREQWLPLPLERVFPFFADAANLEAITPPWLGFHILTPRPIEMRAGTRIDYRLRLGGVPLRWVTHIERWDPPWSFVDVQTSGPYALWDHLHVFEPVGDGVLVIDRVRYALPLGPLGRLAHGIAVRGLLARIFDYRHLAIREGFGLTDALARGRTDGPRAGAECEPGLRGAGRGGALGDVGRDP